MRAHVLPSFLRRLLAVSLCALGACLAASTASAHDLVQHVLHADGGEQRQVLRDLDWMDYLDRRRLVDSASRTLIAGNRLVLVAASNRELQVEIVPGFALASLLQGERLAIADPAHVPAARA